MLKAFCVTLLIFTSAATQLRGLSDSDNLGSDYLENETPDEATDFVEGKIGDAKSNLESSNIDVYAAQKAIADAQGILIYRLV
jgi:hypothetical protein